MATGDRGTLDVERFDLEPHRPILHGLLGDVDFAELAGLPSEDKVPYALRMMDGGTAVAADGGIPGRGRAHSGHLAADGRRGRPERIAGGRGGPANRPRRGTCRPAASASTSRAASTRSTTPRRRTAGDQTDHRAERRAAHRRTPSSGSSRPRFARHPAETCPALAHLDARRCGHHRARTRTHVDDGRRLSRERRRGRGGRVQRAGRRGRRRRSSGRSTFEPGDDACPLRAVLQLRAMNPTPSSPALYEPMLAQGDQPPPRQAGLAARRRRRTPAVPPRSARARDCTCSPRVDDIDKAAAILAESDRIRYLTPRLHAEMISEVRWPGDRSPDSGIDVRSLELDPADLVKLDVLRRPEVMAHLAEWDAGAGLGADTRERVLASSCVAVVSMTGRALTDYARAGSAVEAVWIDRAAAVGWRCSPSHRCSSTPTTTRTSRSSRPLTRRLCSGCRTSSANS